MAAGAGQPHPHCLGGFGPCSFLEGHSWPILWKVRWSLSHLGSRCLLAGSRCGLELGMLMEPPTQAKCHHNPGRRAGFHSEFLGTFPAVSTGLSLSFWPFMAAHCRRRCFPPLWVLGALRPVTVWPGPQSGAINAALWSAWSRCAASEMRRPWAVC